MKSFDLGISHLVIMVGIPGSGKSFFAEHFANTFQAPVISYDKLHKEFISTGIDPKIESSTINHILKYMLKEVSKTKRTIIFDGQTYSQATYEELIKIAHSLNYEPLFVWVQTDAKTAKKRATKLNHGEDRTILTNDQFDKIIKQFSPIDRTKKNVVVISGRHTYPNQLKIVLKYLSQPH